MQIVAMAVPAQEGITRDNVSVRVDAVVYFRVVDPIKATINVQNYLYAISQQAQTSLRSIIGQSEMDQLLAERDSVNRELRRDHRRADRGSLGHPGRARGDQGRLAARGHEAVHVPAGRGRARAARPDHHRRRRVPGVQAPGGGGQRHGQGPGRAPAAAAADGGRGGRRAQQHAGHADPGRAAAVLRQVHARRAAGARRSRRRTRRRWPTSATRSTRPSPTRWPRPRARSRSAPRPRTRSRSPRCPPSPSCRPAEKGDIGTLSESAPPVGQPAATAPDEAARNGTGAATADPAGQQPEK